MIAFEGSNVNLGKFGSFPASELVGKRPGFVYEISNRTLLIQPPKRIEELGTYDHLQLIPFQSNCLFPVDTDANNELITDGEFVQPLTAVEIEALKKSGAKATVSPSRNGIMSNDSSMFSF